MPKHKNMDFFFNPEGIAIIGASDDPARGGFSILKMPLKAIPEKYIR